MKLSLQGIKLGLLCIIFLVLDACSANKATEEVLEVKESVSVLKISPNTPYDAFYKRLSRALTKAGINIGDYRQTTIPTLQIMQDDISTEPLEYDVNDKLRLEEISYELEFKLTNKFGNVIIPSTKLFATKEHKVNPDSEISMLNERDMITYELQQDVIARMIEIINKVNLQE